MKPASATSRAPLASSSAASAASKAGAVGELLDRHDAGRNAERRGARQAAGAVAIGDHSNYRGSGWRRLSEARAMASMLLPRPEMTTATGSTSFLDDYAARAAPDAADDRRRFRPRR